MSDVIDASYHVLTGGHDYGNLDNWLQQRATFIGSSESPAICGVGFATESPLTVWLRKTGFDTEQLDAERLECGQILQPAILELAGRRLGFQVADPGRFTVYRRPERTHVGATLDGFALDSDGTLVDVEAKNVSSFNAEHWQTDEPPLRVQVQVQHQLYATDLQRAYVIGLIGGNRLVSKVVERNQRFIDALLVQLDTFWANVQERIPPPIDGTDATADALRKLYPSCEGGTVDLPAEAEEWDRLLQEAKATIKEAEAVKTKAANQLKAAIAKHEIGILPSGIAYTFKGSVFHYEAKDAYTATHRTLRRKGKP